MITKRTYDPANNQVPFYNHKFFNYSLNKKHLPMYNKFSLRLIFIKGQRKNLVKNKRKNSYNKSKHSFSIGGIISNKILMTT